MENLLDFIGYYSKNGSCGWVIGVLYWLIGLGT